MKRTTFFLFMILALGASAQDLPRFGKWLDEERLSLSRDNGKTWKAYQVRSGTESDYSMPAGLESLLPQGVRPRPGAASTSAAEDKMVVLDKGDLFLLDTDKSWRQLTKSSEEEQNPVFSPDGQKIAYTRAGNLYVYDLASSQERALTTDGNTHILNGYASWVYWEEILGRASFYRAFYWSPDSRHIAFLRFDDRPVPEFPIYHDEAADMTHGYLEIQRYPKSG
ncbi:MAG: DPP IV N-terminal domain-containing protein, partial [Haliscomenobacter sp.]